MHFMGFAPRAPAARRRFFEQLPLLAGNIMLFESPRRMENAVSLLREFFGDNARAVVGRELTKAHEQIEDMPLSALSAALSEGKIPLRGEFSLMVESPGASPLSLAGRRLFEALAKELPPRKAAAIAAPIWRRIRRRPLPPPPVKKTRRAIKLLSKKAKRKIFPKANPEKVFFNRKFFDEGRPAIFVWWLRCGGLALWRAPPSAPPTRPSGQPPPDSAGESFP